MRSRIARQATACALIAGAVLLGSGCASSAASISCEKFISLAESEQNDAVEAWREHNRIASIKGLENMQVREDRAALLRYCSDPGHGRDRLTDLEYSWR